MAKKACSYCGRIHEKSYLCKQKKNATMRKKRDTEAVRIRSTAAWQKARQEAKERDNYLCRWCLAEGRANYKDLEVHHIIPVEQNKELALELDNLITLCKHLH